MGKLRPREAKMLAQGHTWHPWQSQAWHAAPCLSLTLLCPRGDLATGEPERRGGLSVLGLRLLSAGHQVASR